MATTATRTTIRELSDALFDGRLDIADPKYHPVNGRLLYGDEVVTDVFVYESCATCNVVDTGAGLVMLDTGRRSDRDGLYEAVREWRPDTPLVAAIFSHHHLDHIFGTLRFEREAAERGWAQPVVYAHENTAANFERYKLTAGWQTAINRRQLPGDDIFDVSAGDSFPTDFRYPDVTFSDRMVLKIGRYTFDMRHVIGETDDHIWTWIPELKAAHSGDQFIWAVPNAGNPQKVQRFAREWAQSLRAMAAMDPELLLAGHGYPIFGADKCQKALLAHAELLESLEEQTLALMNQGASLDEVIHAVQVPEHLRDLPYMLPIYDHPQFIVRAVWRRYGGWWTRQYDELLPAPREQQAREWIALAGGVEPVLARIAALRAAGDLRMACHLVELAVLAEPSDEVYRVRSELWEARAGEQTATMVRNVMLHASYASRVQRLDMAAEDAGLELAGA